MRLLAKLLLTKMLLTKMILRNFISLRAFTVYMENSLQFEI